MTSDAARISNVKNPLASLFGAINIAAKCGGETSCVRKDSLTGDIVWQKSDIPKFYCYIGQEYHGFVSTEQEAKKWSEANEHSHVLTGHQHILEPPITIEKTINDAYPIYEHVNNIKGSNEAIWPERNHGAYYYNFSKFTNEHKKISATFDLSEATFRLVNSEIEHRPINAYVFLGVKNPEGRVYEAGYVISSERFPIKISPYLKASGSVNYNFYDGFDLIESNGVYKYGDSLKVSLTIPEDKVVRARFDKIKTLQSETKTTNDEFAVVDEKHRWFMGISLVSYYNEHCEVFDCRSGCYAKNIKIKDAFVYDSPDSEDGISFSTDADISEHVHLYNTDCISRTSSGNGDSSMETISIFYDEEL